MKGSSRLVLSVFLSSSYLICGTPAAACIGGGILYGKGNLAATAGFSNSMAEDVVKYFVCDCWTLMSSLSTKCAFNFLYISPSNATPTNQESLCTFRFYGSILPLFTFLFFKKKKQIIFLSLISLWVSFFSNFFQDNIILWNFVVFRKTSKSRE